MRIFIVCFFIFGFLFSLLGKRMRLFLSFFFIFGFLIAAVPSYYFMKSPSIEEVRQERAAMAAWPSVTGTLDEVRFQRQHRYGRGVTWHYIDVRYRYAVDGRTYEGSRFGIQLLRDTSREELRALMYRRFVASKNIVKEEEGPKGYEEPGYDPDHGEPRTVWHLRNQQVTVYYDPTKPESSLLDTHDYDPPAIIKDLVSLSAFLALGLVIMTVSVWKWRDLKSGRTDATIRIKKLSPPANKNCYESSHWMDCLEMAEYLMQERKFSEALTAFDRSLSLNPWEAGTVSPGLKTLLGKAECLIELGRFEEAHRCLDEVLSSGRGLQSADILKARANELKRSTPVSQSGGARQKSPDGKEPVLGMMISEVSVAGVTLKPSEYVWILGTAEKGLISVEHRNVRVALPEGSLLPCPIPAPDINDLRKKDDCFGRPEKYFTEIYKSEQHLFRLLKCKRHGSIFLEDSCGGVGMYTLTILVADPAEDPETMWSRYHSMSDDWLNYQFMAYRS